MKLPEIEELFDLSRTVAAGVFAGKRYPWEILPELKDYIVSLSGSLSGDEYYSPKPLVFISKTARVSETAEINGPCIVCDGAEIRHGAYIRGGVVVGRGSVVGNSTELKNCLLFDGAKVPHFNYVGDTVLGYGVHFGAGAVASNVRTDGAPVSVSFLSKRIGTGLRKFGAAVGDGCEIGCNSVLCPGSVLGRGTTVYPGIFSRGYIPPGVIVKSDGNYVLKEERN